MGQSLACLRRRNPGYLSGHSISDGRAAPGVGVSGGSGERNAQIVYVAFKEQGEENKTLDNRVKPLTAKMLPSFLASGLCVMVMHRNPLFSFGGEGGGGDTANHLPSIRSSRSSSLTPCPLTSSLPFIQVSCLPLPTSPHHFANMFTVPRPNRSKPSRSVL